MSRPAPMQISIRHVTTYRYAEPVNYTIQSLRLTPASFTGQRVVNWAVRTPGSRATLQFEDGFGNVVHLLTINAPHQELVIEAGGTVETKDCSGVVAGLKHAIPSRVFLKETARTRPDSAIRQLAQAAKGADALGRLHGLSASVRDRVEYVPGITDAHTGAAEALADGKGVCQDHAHIFIAAARTIGVPARYVTGYLVTGEGSAMLTTPGPKPGSRGSAGSGSTSPTASARPSATSGSLAVSMPATPRRSPARARAAPMKSSTSPWKCSSRARNSDDRPKPAWRLLLPLGRRWPEGPDEGAFSANFPLTSSAE